MSEIYNSFPYYGYGTEDGSSYYKRPQPMDGEAVESAIDEKINDLVGNAPSNLDTIEELAAAVETGSGDSSDIYEKIDEVEAKIPTSLEGLDNTETKYQTDTEVAQTVDGAIEDLFASVEYDSNEKKIIFKNGEGTQVGEVDATDFIKDGMVNGASVENGKLIITFNEESGSSDVEIDITDIFNPDNYYTKQEAASKTDIAGFITEDAADEKYQAAGDYALKSELPDLTDYALKSELPDLTDYALKSELPDLTDYALKSDIPDVTGYATEQFVTQQISAIPIPTVPVNVSSFTNDAGYLNKETADTYYQPIGEYLTEHQSLDAYYTGEYISENFVGKTEFEETLSDYTTGTDLMAVVNELNRRLNKLEATNAYLIENNTNSAAEISGMTPEVAATTEITVSTDEAIASLSTPKTFKSINIVGGELGDNTEITLSATDDVNVTGLTVNGEKGEGNGKINYATSEINIESIDINPGCTVYNVFEGSQDLTAEHSIDRFTAKNITVDDVDLAHNVFNIYQLNDNAVVTISDSSFNLDVANSNVLRLSNITNARNVTVNFNNIDLTYENKAYTDEDVKWAGLVIYQAYGNDAAFAGDTSNIQTWTFNFVNCRYNGQVVTTNEVGTIRQLIYQYKVNNQGCEAPTAFGAINISAE